jgi:AhpD family alkylhydroperoxidase
MTRLDYRSASPQAFRAMLALEKSLHTLGLDPKLLHLVKMRASQINGCGFCLDMHAREARAAGELQQRLDVLPAWREVDLFDPRERAALAWTEALTLIAQTHAPDADYDLLSAHFDEQERVALTLAIVAINGWNRFAIGFRSAVAKADS